MFEKAEKITWVMAAMFMFGAFGAFFHNPLASDLSNIAHSITCIAYAIVPLCLAVIVTKLNELFPKEENEEEIIEEAEAE